jgi:hypothetical protein
MKLSFIIQSDKQINEKLMRNACNILVGQPEERRDHLEDLSVDEKIILEWILEK